MTPPFHPFSSACLTHMLSASGDMYLFISIDLHHEKSTYPLLAAPALIGLPMTILLSGIPA
jgi:hypothetical protein